MFDTAGLWVFFEDVESDSSADGSETEALLQARSGCDLGVGCGCRERNGFREVIVIDNAERKCIGPL